MPLAVNNKVLVTKAFLVAVFNRVIVFYCTELKQYHYHRILSEIHDKNLDLLVLTLTEIDH